MRTTKIKLSDLKIGAVKFYAKLPADLEERAKTLYPDVTEHELTESMTLEKWIEGFTYDAHPEKEIEIWEKMVATYKDAVNFIDDKQERRDIWRTILSVSLGV